ncbi:MAG: hypothetical protein RIK87_14355 [Fuerstiella sp.]
MPRANLRIIGRPEYNAGIGSGGHPYAILDIDGGSVYVLPSLYTSIDPQVNIHTTFEINPDAVERFTDLYGRSLEIVVNDNDLQFHFTTPRPGSWGFSGGVEWQGQRARQHTILVRGIVEPRPRTGEQIEDHIVTHH